MKSLRILDAIVLASEVGYQPDYKTLATLRAQLIYDLAPYLNDLEWPVFSGPSVFAPPAEEVE